MLSDESSSDSETGRFKCRSKTQDEQTTNQKSNPRETERSRQFGNDRFNRSFERRRDNKNPRDRHKYSRHSPVSRKRHSRDRSSKRSFGKNRHRESSDKSPKRRSLEKNRHRESSDKSPKRRSLDKIRHRESSDKSPKRRSLDKIRHRESSDRSKPRDYRSHSKDKHKYSKSRSHILHDNRKSSKEDNKYNVVHNKSPEKLPRKSREKSLSPGYRAKRSEIYRPPPLAVKRSPEKRKTESPIIIDENDHSDVEVPLGSYYSMIPAVLKEKSDDSSEIDSSDDEKLRAKLLKREHHESKKQKKHKKKHKRKSSKSSKERESQDTSVEVSSTTDIKPTADVSDVQLEVVEEVTSTQKNVNKDSCEEGEISSDDSQIDIDPTDLRHKLRRSANKTDGKSKDDVCGPALPPHLEKQYKRSISPELEGPALPPHLQRSKNLGPTIPDNMRKVLAEREREVIKYESSDEDNGIGPLPAGSEEKWSDAHRRLEERALDIKIKKLDGHSEEKVKSREKWMLELPEGRAKYIGLEARSFRAKEGPDMSDRSSWTDTPEEKARKAAGHVKEADLDMKLKEESRLRHIANRDDEQESAVKKHKKKHKREESLLEMHQKKLKKKKKKEEKDDGKKERRPFSRDVDLQVNRFDEAQKKSIIKKAQDLNSRFGRGEAKYL